MIRRVIRSLLVVLALTAASGLHAQQPADAVFARARQLVVNGSAAAGRLLVDSVLTATPADSPVYADALYWRAALAAATPDAERDYRRLIVEYPTSRHVADALWQLAQIESARNDRAAATAHLEQFLADNPQSDDRPRATLLYVRLLLEQNELPRGCSALRQTLRDVPADAVEMRNQLEYYLPRCAASDVGPGGAVPVSPPTTPAAKATPGAGLTPAPSTARDSLRSAPVPTVAPKARFTLQVAAYKTKAQAAALAKKLQARHIDARVVSTATLHRVRIGHYATRAGAVAAQRELLAKKIDAFVTEIGPDDK